MSGPSDGRSGPDRTAIFGARGNVAILDRGRDEAQRRCPALVTCLEGIFQISRNTVSKSHASTRLFFSTCRFCIV